MKIKSILMIFCCMTLSTGIVFADTTKPKVRIQTTLGLVVIELDSQAAPKTVDNFLQYARSGFYNQTIFHRVIKGFMIQGGGLTADMQKKKTAAPIANEADNGLKNVRGSIAMARTMDPNSATAQFFINPLLDPAEVTLKADRVKYWIDQGALPSDTVKSILKKEGLFANPA